MEKKRSKGVTIFGLILLVFGLWRFFTSIIFEILFFYNNTVMIEFWAFIAKSFPALRNTGITFTEIGGGINSLMKMVYIDSPFLIFVSFIIMPLLDFLIFMGGIGILRLEERWRKNTIITFALSMFIAFGIRVYFKLYLFSTIIIGKIMSPGREDVVLGVRKLIKTSPSILLKDLVVSTFLVCLVILFFTRSRVKEQFR